MGWSSSGDELIVAMVENSGMNRALATEVRLSRISITGQDNQSIASLQDTYLAGVHLSPNGQFVCFVSMQDGKDNIWILPVAGGEAKKITNNADPKAYFSGLAWSPDGKEIYYGKQASWGLVTLIENFK